ncbi:DUF1573 domain-containing protein [soil metagenome]
MKAILAAFAVALVFALPASGQAVLSFDHTEYDFGEVTEGEVARHTFRFTNTGTAPLSLTEVVASCGCTTPHYTRDAVAPGEGGEVVVEYASQGRPGPIDRTVAVRASGATPANVTLYITGNVVPVSMDGERVGSLVFADRQLDLGEVNGAEPVVGRFRLQNVGQRPVRVNNATHEGSSAEVVFARRAIFLGSMAEVEVVLVDPVSGPFDVLVALETDDSEEPTKHLRLTGIVL